MKCAKCGYMLFGLSECRCPECGTLFQTTDFAFPPQAVHFLCPHCAKPYFGTDVHGLPNPRTFRCVRCHQIIRAATMSVRPVRDGVEGEPLRFGIAWEHLGRRTFASAFLQTATQAALRPGEFFRMAYAADRKAALAFSAVVATLSMLLLMAILLLTNRAYPAALAWIPTRFLAPRFLIGAVIAVTGLWTVWCWVYAHAAGIVLLLLGVRDLDMDAVTAAPAYASAVFPALAMPLIGLPWYLIVVAAGLREMTPSSSGQAWTAALLPVLLLANVCILAAIL
ncbi:MAG: hypothetical protein U1A27_13865 [Phycisphaerae bacterium]